MKTEKEPQRYREKLDRQLKKIEKELINAYQTLQKNITDANIRTWNNLNADKATIISRIENLGKTGIVLPTHNINSSILK